jgi:hypothetical protein
VVSQLQSDWPDLKIALHFTFWKPITSPLCSRMVGVTVSLVLHCLQLTRTPFFHRHCGLVPCVEEERQSHTRLSMMVKIRYSSSSRYMAPTYRWILLGHARSLSLTFEFRLSLTHINRYPIQDLTDKIFPAHIDSSSLLFIKLTWSWLSRMTAWARWFKDERKCKDILDALYYLCGSATIDLRAMVERAISRHCRAEYLDRLSAPE